MIEKRDIPKPDYKKRAELAMRAVEKVKQGRPLQDIIDELAKEYEPNFFETIGIKIGDAWRSIKKQKSTWTGRIGLLISIIRLIITLKKQGNIMEFLRSIIKGDSLVGKILFAIIDILPIPNFHEIFKSVWKKHPELSLWEKLKLVIKKIDLPRTVAAIVIAIAVALGWIDIETLTDILG